VAALLLPGVEQTAGAADEIGEDFDAGGFVAGAEVEAEAHPIEFEAGEVVAGAVLFKEGEVVVADGLVGEIKGPVPPVDGAPGDAAVFGVLAPEGRVHEAVGVVDIMQIVHAHGDPGRQAFLPRAFDPDGVGIEVTIGEVPGGVDPAADAGAARRGGGTEQGLIVGAGGVVALPDGVPDFAGEAGALGVSREE